MGEGQAGRFAEQSKSVEVFCEECYSQCSSLASVAFAVDWKLSRLEQKVFSKSESLVSITFDPNSRLQGHKSELLAGKKALLAVVPFANPNARGKSIRSGL
jgi:hypothetical protein